MPARIGRLEGPALHIDMARRLSPIRQAMLKGRVAGDHPVRVKRRAEAALVELGLIDERGAPTLLGRAVAGYLL